MGTVEPNVLILSSVMVAGLRVCAKVGLVHAWFAALTKVKGSHIKGVQIGPGATALHLIPLEPTTWLLRALMNAMIAPLVAV